MPNKDNKSDSIFFTDSQNPETYSLKNQIAEHLEFRLVKDRVTATLEDIYKAVSLSVRDRMIRNWLRTQNQYYRSDVKRVYYLSMEFLMGRLLGNALTNLGFYEECHDLVQEMGYDLEAIIDVEHDMGLGNGGLGRLAACFLDSMATLELPAFGYGIRYEYGIFEQDIIKGYQVERPDNWLHYGSPWEIIRPEYTYKIQFHGRIESYTDNSGKTVYKWVGTKDVMAVAYDVPVPGYNNHTCNNLRLWEAKATHDFDFSSFNEGDYIKAVENKYETENISKVLYPNDNTVAGKELRLKQQYFFVSASLQDIIRRYKVNHSNFSYFADKNTLQLNDTHPAIAIPELMRILIDQEGLQWDEAWAVTTNTFAYTNHTVLSEALERWSVELFGRLLPRHLQIVFEINARFLSKIRMQYHNDVERIKRMSIIEEGDDKKIRMAHLAIVGSFSVNGVAALHTEIIKAKVFPDFYNWQPYKFNSKTNGITQRRWLKKANPFLSQVITEKIGDGWITDLYKLRDLEKYSSDNDFLELINEAKWTNKKKLISYIENNYNIKINPKSIFDTQIKRIHEYKRQLLNVIHIVALYNRIKENPNADFVPRTMIFGGKSAPGYHTAKMIIKLIHSIADIINNDPDVGDKLKVVFLKNYSVTLAELIIPASDLSEQISTAGYEASGTGNMKFQLNGALTIGTLDGANIEMMEEMGRENMYIFGLNSDEVAEIHRNGYNPYYYYETNHELKSAIDLIKSNYFNDLEPGIFDDLMNSLLYHGDKYCLLADFESYSIAQNFAAEEFNNQNLWAQKSLLNIARVGKFSSDRTIKQYADEIWKISSHPIISTNGKA
ncbi:MAG: glycogen/starch/alpha-glucan phosphorylase [Candidatus Kapabacteria bacterium]|nr:glycogen/starch/alpha-glucan phosphorylase [Ignavibacteriota bacterium]MCW5885428.1 glycogen/starch/alpha-glucan phosphorylase [Candidatus Kapabacteria bacterium]